MDRFIALTENGFLLEGEAKIQDPERAQAVLKSLQIQENKIVTAQLDGEPVIVEVFDEPYIAHTIRFENEQWWLETAYHFRISFELKTLTTDEWDRFHGIAANGIPFVLSAEAQNQLFEAMDEFDDDSITWKGQKIPIAPYWSDHPEINQSKYWSQVYETEPNPGWNLNEPAQALQEMLPRLKLPKSRILVLGCGEGHDAALFAQEGHLVTAVDFSALALEKAKKKYANLKIDWVEKDVFQLPREWIHKFDLVFEHTCFCAINPVRRNELTQVWSQMLHPQGQLMGIFFTMEKKEGPPYGASEWELRRRLDKKFDFLFWGRWRTSIPRRKGRELFVLARKRAQ